MIHICKICKEEYNCSELCNSFKNISCYCSLCAMIKYKECKSTNELIYLIYNKTVNDCQTSNINKLSQKQLLNKIVGRLL